MYFQPQLAIRAVAVRDPSSLVKRRVVGRSLVRGKSWLSRFLARRPATPDCKDRPGRASQGGRSPAGTDGQMRDDQGAPYLPGAWCSRTHSRCWMNISLCG